MRRSIKVRAQELQAPPLDRPGMVESGYVHFRERCVQCHGAPGVARDALGKGLTPVPANLVQTARTWSAEEIFWTVKNGIKMTGMPAWRFELDDDAIWSVVAFVKRLPLLTPAEYRAMGHARDAGSVGSSGDSPEWTAATFAGASPERGRLALQHYACHACHVIPGIVGPQADVGPPLDGMGARRFIAGVLSNTPQHMVRWIRSPQEVDPLTAMPDLGVRPRDATDMAAYLYTLR